MKLKKVFISRGCSNKQDCFVVSYADQNEDAYIAYASGEDIVVANTATNEIDFILRNHKSNVNCLCLCPNLQDGYYSSFLLKQNEIVSCDCNGLVTVWLYSDKQWSIKESFVVDGLIESVSCHAVNNTESILSITTDKRELFLYKRSSLESSWNLMLQITSPHPDIYYTSTGCLPLIDSMESASQTSNSVLLFLCGTDHHIYVNELSLTSNSMQSVCVLTGFENWISGIRFHRMFDENDCISHWSVIASGQDGRCRIWKIEKCDENSITTISTHNHHVFTMSSQSYLITLESVIEMSGTILSLVEPHPVCLVNNHYSQPLYLLSSSLDGTVKIYSPEDVIHGTGVFNAIATLQPHLIGSQGFWGAFWLQTLHHRYLFGYGYQGAMFKWEEENYTDSTIIDTFSLKPFLSGHFHSSRASFTRYGNLILSSSLDRTVRIWGREINSHHWEEVCRPVVHGYPVTGAVIISDHFTNEGCSGMTNKEIGRLVTVNEEKKCRVFNNTLLNMITFNTLVDCYDSQHYHDDVKIEELSNRYYWSSFAPELGLSNKGIPLDQAQSTLTRFQLDVDANKGLMVLKSGEEKNDVEEDENSNDPMMLMAGDGELELVVSLDVLQTINNRGNNNLNESRLCKGTLMNESTYLYNTHTINNFYSIAVDYSRDCIFTTTVGADENESVISVWNNRDCGNDNENLKRVQYLKGHRSTVVSLTPFVMSGIPYLISVGKDRQILVWKSDENGSYSLNCKFPKAHARIIWSSCTVLQGLDGFAVFATGSRDKTVKLWKTTGGDELIMLKEIECDDSVKSIACSHFIHITENDYETILSVGLENGTLLLYSVSISLQLDRTTVELKSSLELRKTIQTIDWLPIEKEPGINRGFDEYYGSGVGNLVVGCEDGGVYLYHASE